MADINISISDNLFSIKLDIWEWESLEVNGQNIPAKSNGGNVQFEYTQSEPGHITFTAKANQHIDIVNPGNIMFMKDGENTGVAIISYSETTSEVTLAGSCFIHNGDIENAQPSPLRFSQGRMTGTFELAA